MELAWEIAKQNSKNKTQSSELSTTGKVIMYAMGGIALGVAAVCLPFFVALRKACPPYVPSNSLQILGVRQALAGHSGRLLDVGSGDGRIVFTAVKLGFQADGVELNPWLVFYSRIAASLNWDYRDCKFYLCDLWKFDLKPYNNIVIAGVDYMMKDFETKLLKETNNNTVVVSCRFPLPNMTPVRSIGSGDDTVWKYIIKK